MSTTTNNGTGNDCPCVKGERPNVEAYLWGIVCPVCGSRLLPCRDPNGPRGQSRAHCLGDDSATPTRRGCGWHGPRSQARNTVVARLTSPRHRDLEWMQEMQASFADRDTLRDQALRTIHRAARLPLSDSDGAIASEVLWHGSEIDALKSELSELRDLLTGITGLDVDTLARLVSELQRRGVLPTRKPEPEPAVGMRGPRATVTIDDQTIAASPTAGDLQSPPVRRCNGCGRRTFDVYCRACDLHTVT